MRLALQRRECLRQEELWGLSLDRSHHARADVLHGETQLARLRIDIQMKHESLLHDLLVGVRVEGLIHLLAGVGYDLPTSINGREKNHI